MARQTPTREEFRKQNPRFPEKALPAYDLLYDLLFKRYQEEQEGVKRQHERQPGQWM